MGFCRNRNCRLRTLHQPFPSVETSLCLAESTTPIYIVYFPKRKTKNARVWSYYLLSSCLRSGSGSVRVSLFVREGSFTLLPFLNLNSHLPRGSLAFLLPFFSFVPLLQYRPLLTLSTKVNMSDVITLGGPFPREVTSRHGPHLPPAPCF